MKATDELGLLDGLETVHRPRPTCSWAPSARSGLGIARDSSGPLDKAPMRRAARRVALVPLLALLALAAPGDGPFESQSPGPTVSSTERLTTPPASARPLDARVFHHDGSAVVAATGRGAEQSFTLPASPGAASSRPVSTYHVPVLMYHRIAPRSERGHDLPDLPESRIRVFVERRNWHAGCRGDARE